jgi:nicotinamidase-related amidase
LKSGKIRREKAIVVVVDMQEKLLPAMKKEEDIEEKAGTLIRGARLLGVPILVTEQYPKGLGRTVKPIQEALGEFTPIEKTSFSIMGEPQFVEALKESGAEDVVLCGIESHVCVQQSALDLLAGGYRVYVMEDATGSRSNTDKKFAGRRMVEAGCVGTTVESALFEMVEDAKAPCFRDLSKLVK